MIKIGQSMHPNWVNGDLIKLDEELRLFNKAGAECCELVLQGLDVVIGARVIEQRMRAVIDVLRRHDFVYTLHLPHGLNLLDAENLEVNMRVFRAAIDFARAAGISLLNHHAGMYKIDDKIKLDGKAPPDSNTMIKNEIEQVKSLAQEAPDIIFCMENALFGTDPEISAAAGADSMIEFYKQVDLPNFKLTFDIGHSYLWNKGDNSALLGDMAKLLPYVGHIHLHDNCGVRVGMRAAFGGNGIVTGGGDIHLPLGWGNLPIIDALALTKDYEGIINLEIEQRFKEYYGQCIAFVREQIASM
ncbi:MAG: sugar phosphate isomerase/epimerase [Oscillospiraceae bacterium]|nr:sugar phosphate isomerase/epimerase [Oscillospiraceae bacterium]